MDPTTLAIAFITAMVIIYITRTTTRDRINAREHAERAEQRATECAHVWGDWKTIQEGPIVRERGGIPYGQFIRQARTCTMCNKTELDTHKTTT